MSRNTLHLWIKSDLWQKQMERLEKLENEASAEMAIKHKEKYKEELMRSRDILKSVHDQQLQSAAEYTIAARRATQEITRKYAPEDAVERLAKGGACYVSSTAAQVSKAAKDQLDSIYAINRVLQFIDSQEETI